MVRTIPHGVQVGQVVRALVATEMSNGKIAPAKVRYEIRVVYPGGVIIKAARFSGLPLTAAEDEDAPGGLLKAGTPVHVEGEPDPTDDDLARFVHAGVLATSVLARGDEVADAADFALTGVWDYRVVASRRMPTPRQASVICDILIESGKTDFLESEILKLMRDQGARFASRQNPTHIFKYYRTSLITCGFLTVRK